MDTIRRIPVLLGTGTAIVTGAAGYAAGLTGRECIARMAVVMAAFFIIGLFLRSSLRNMMNEVEEKRKETEREKEKEAAEAALQEAQAAENEKGTSLDLRIGEDTPSEGVFQPGPVAEFIRREMDNG